MRRTVVTTAATAAGLVLLLSLKPHDAPEAAGAASPQPGPASTGAASPGGSGGTSSGGSSTASPSPSSSPSASGSSGSGSSGSSGAAAKTYTGQEAETQFGPVQVRITVSGKKITKAEAVEYPTDRPRDQEINSYAVPQLDQEVLAAQGATIDAVSGATYTSEGYLQSLQSALDQAGL